MSLLVGVAFLALVLSDGGVLAFAPIGGGASSHVSITGTALLQKVTEVCRDVIEDGGDDFNPTGPSPEELVRACLGPTATGEVSAAKFRSALNQIYVQNGLVDRDFANSPQHHFNSEAFAEGRALITEGLASIKANIASKNYQAARETLGRVLHTLQDFYSHSNWVELGHKEPYLNLIRPDLALENLAGVDTPTCSDCASGTCPNQILPSILKEKKLTSGYMGIFSPAKPPGKCSHGGGADLTSTTNPRGGINKDERRPDNADFHDNAIAVATAASLQLLDNIRNVVGNGEYLRLMGIARSSVIVFVIDTTGSMANDIEEARRVVFNIIDTKKGTQDEPSEYILVPFNDPAFGPLIRTINPDIMKAEISKLKADGGGDTPEMCLSGLQLALTGAPGSSHIYVFTDAEAKDIALKDTIVALIRSTKSTVSFFMTGSGRSRRDLGLRAGFDAYRDLALASGGQAILVSKSSLPQATDIILDSSTSALVTVLQRARNPGKTETFSFLLDASLTNITIYITGTSVPFILKNPAGVTQSQAEASGKLGMVFSVGNLQRIRLNPNKLAGVWEINVQSSSPYTLKVTGQSIITFIYDFVEAFEGPHPGYAVITGRPQAGNPAMLLVSVMGRKGPASVKVGDVSMVTVSGSEVVRGDLKDVGNGDFLVTVTKVPAGEFVVLLNGTDVESASEFQRQSTTQMSVSTVSIKAVIDSSVEPGEVFSLPFTVVTSATSGSCTFSVKNDRGIPMVFPASIPVSPAGVATSTLTVTPPASTPSGTDVTLTLEAKAPGGGDSNYAVLRLSVVKKITDFTPPQCKLVSIEADHCPYNCPTDTTHRWGLSANISDVNGTGIKSLTLRQGNGNLTHTSLSDPVVTATYNASCCSQVFELVIVDNEGNVGNCFHSIVRSSGPAPLALSLPLLVCLLGSALTPLRDFFLLL
ncbi:von Willebrand factor A domain-containing protein 7 [Osmerus eperlanus]|uniref:von Willebrand factor A domain-containing protein 7 n=1 Tax=Osmerus eperlanus TaxID=29151 RepID=UPI002E0EC434